MGCSEGGLSIEKKRENIINNHFIYNMEDL